MKDRIVSAMIDDAIRNFDFDLVRRVMLFLDWRWGREESGEVPHCGTRAKEPGRAYCAECRRELQREWNKNHARKKQPRKNHRPEFIALLEEARCISFRHLKDMGLIGRAR